MSIPPGQSPLLVRQLVPPAYLNHYHLQMYINYSMQSNVTLR